MATAGAAKSREAHRHRPKQRRHSMKPPVLDMTRLTARRAIRTQDRMVVGLYGDHHSLQAREDLLRLGQCQPQLRNIAEITKRLDIHHVDDPRRTINPGFDQAQDPPHPQTPSQQPIGQSYRLRLYPPTSGTLPSDGLDEPQEPLINMRDDLCTSATNAAMARCTEGHTMTALRDIVVVLDDAAPSETRLTIAIALAQQHNAYLIGLSALELMTPARPVVQPRDPLETDAPPASLFNLGALPRYDYPDADTQVAEKAEQIEAAFRERLRLNGLQGDWRIASGRFSEAVIHQAWHADLII